MKKILVLLTAVAIATFTNCSTEEKTDIRDAAVGSYTGKISFYAIQNDGLVTLESDIPDATISATVSKDANNSAIIKITADGDVFTGKVAEASNGFSFDIAEQTVSNTLISGYNFDELGSVKYHGLFTSTNKKLIFGVKIPANSDIFDDKTQQTLTSSNITQVVIGIELNKK